MEDEVEDDEVEDDDVNREEDDDVENYNVEEEEEEEEEDDVEEGDRSQDLDPRFVQACAVETHVKISQEPLDTEIYRKNAAAQIEPRTQTNTLCEPAQWKRMSRFHKSHLIRKFTGKMPRPRLSPERRRTLCASLRSRNACQDFARATLLYGNSGKMLQTKAAPQTLCDPAQSKRTSRFHKSHFTQKCTGKMPQTKLNP